MSTVSFVPTADADVGTLLVAHRSVLLHAGEPRAESVDPYLACDDVEGFAARSASPFAAARWDGLRLELWCRGRVSLAPGERVITGGDELHHEVVDLTSAAAREVAMWLGGGGSPPAALAATPYQSCSGAVPATAGMTRVVVAEPPADPIDELFGPTVARDVEVAAVRADTTACANAALAVMLFSTGERVVIDRTTVIGRRPHEVSDPAPSSRQRLVALACPSVSRQHAVVRLDRWCATIEDLGSANGTSLAHGDEPLTVLQRATPADLMIGSRVVLGGDVSFVVEAIE